MGIIRGWGRFSLLFLCVFYSKFCFANTSVTLKNILSFQKEDKVQKSLIQSKSLQTYYNNLPLNSPWLLELNSSIENRFSIREEFVGFSPIDTSRTYWSNRVTQQTPYGLALSLDYDKELGSPNLRGMFTDQRIRGLISLSLYNDFLGKNTRDVNSGNEDYKIKVIENEEVLRCVDLSKKYIDAFVNAEKLKILNKNLKELKALYKKVSKASQIGAISRNDTGSLSADISNSEIQQMSSKANLTDSYLDLQNISGFKLLGKDLKEPTYFGNINFNEKRFLNKDLKHIELLNLELYQLKKQLKLAKLQDQKDISLIAGIEATNFNEVVTNQSGDTSAEFIGLQASWRFNDKNTSDRINQIKALINLKTSEISNLRSSDLARINGYKEEVVVLSNKLTDLLKASSKSLNLERRLLARFKNGNAKYFEFLSARNQVVQLNNSVIDTKGLYWKRIVDLLFLTGQYKLACAQEG